MKKNIVVLALFATAVAAVSAWSAATMESAKGGADLSFAAVNAVPFKAVSGQQNLRCTTRLGFGSPGYTGRCPHNRVVTGVQIIGSVVQLSCAEVEVDCR